MYLPKDFDPATDVAAGVDVSDIQDLFIDLKKAKKRSGTLEVGTTPDDKVPPVAVEHSRKRKGFFFP